MMRKALGLTVVLTAILVGILSIRLTAAEGDKAAKVAPTAKSEQVTLTVVPVSETGKISEPRDATFPIVNEVFSGVYDVDKSRVFIPLAQGQELLRLDAAPLYDTTAEPIRSISSSRMRWPLPGGATPARRAASATACCSL